MGSYRVTVGKLQPIIEKIFDAFAEGLAVAHEEQVRNNYRRKDDPHHFSGQVRRYVMQALKDRGLIALKPNDDRPEYAMSALRVNFGGLALWIFKVDHPFGSVLAPEPSTKVFHQVPVARSVSKRAFWRQEPVLDGLETDNILLLWSEYEGELCPRMSLVRTVAGDHRRATLQWQWAGHLRREMATFSATDLEELRPLVEQPMLGMDGA